MTKAIQYQTFLRLIGVGVDSDNDRPDVYYLLYEAEKDRPIMHDDKIVFFTDCSMAADIANEYAKNVQIDNLDINAPFMVCDIVDTLHYLTEGGIDDQSTVLNSINLLLDLVDAICLPAAKQIRPILGEIADHCTLSRDLSDLLQKQTPYSTEHRLNAVLLSIGGVVVHSKLVHS